MDYRKLGSEGGCHFFTLQVDEGGEALTAAWSLGRLRRGFARARSRRPFAVHGIVVLPDHLHCIWGLPRGDRDYMARWRQIQAQHEGAAGCRCAGGLEMRFWHLQAHWIGGLEDWQRHMDYLHFDPVRHGRVAAPGDWPHSSFRRLVAAGFYEPAWGRTQPWTIQGLDLG